MRFEKYGKYWAVYDDANELVCITVYQKGAKSVIRRLEKVLPLSLSELESNQKYLTELKHASIKTRRSIIPALYTAEH